MPAEVRFNALGIPYLVEFANVTFRSRSDSRSSSRASMRTLASRRDASESQPLRLRPSTSRSTIASEWTFATYSSTASASSATLTCPAPVPDKGKDEGDVPPEGEHGLYIRFASQLAQPPTKLSESRLARLKYRIAKAVLAAGMDTSPSAECGDPMDDTARARASISSIRSENVERDGLPGSLFRGTYGQVMTALRAAGLATVPCTESGVQNATCLGALFVAHSNERGGVDFTKLTLWA